MSHIDLLKHSDEFSNFFLKKKHLNYWIRHFRHIKKNAIDTWDAQWQYSILYNGGIVVSPNINMIENIGFGIDATHTSSNDKRFIPVGEISSTLRCPPTVDVDMQADDNLISTVYERSIYRRITSKVLSIIR